MPLELLQAAAGVILGIKRSWFLVLGVPFARCILSILFLQVSTVGKQQAAQGHAATGAVDPAAEPLFDPCGPVARLVQSSEELLVGRECVSPCRSRWWPLLSNKN